MRKTRSRHNHATIKIEADNKDEDKMETTVQPVRKRGRRNIQHDDQTSSILTSESKETNSTKEIDETNEINEEIALSSKKSTKTITKKQNTRKGSGHSKKEFSKSNFCMTKILQNIPIKEKESQKGIFLIQCLYRGLNISTINQLQRNY